MLVFFKAVYHANPGAERKRAGSCLYFLRHIFPKLLNTSASNNVWLWTYKLWYYLTKYSFSKSLQTLLVYVYSVSVISSMFRGVQKSSLSGSDVSLNFS